MLFARRAVPALLLAGALLAGCSSATATPSDTTDGDTTTVASAYGDVQVPADPQRVAAVSYETPWQLMAVGVQPIATMDYSRWSDSFTPEQLDWVADAADVGGFRDLNYEAIAAARPDVIVADSYEVDEESYEQLSAIAPTVVVEGSARGDWETTSEQAAAAVGRLDEWAAGKASYEQVRDETKDRYRDVIEGNTWVNFSFGDDVGQFSVQLPTGSTGHLVVDEMGLAYGPGVPLEDPDNFGYRSFSVEELPQVFTGVTVALTFSGPDGALLPGVQEVVDSPVFQTLPVAADGHVYGIFVSVSDYVTAQQWVEELTSTVLQPLSA